MKVCSCTICEELECQVMLLYLQTKEQTVIIQAQIQLELQTKNDHLFMRCMYHEQYIPAVDALSDHPAAFS